MLCCWSPLSFPIFLAEALVGRRTHANAIGAMNKLAPQSFWTVLGYLSVITPTIIVSYYSIVGGWSIEYFLKSFSLNYGEFRPSGWTPLIFNTGCDACHEVIETLQTNAIIPGLVKNGTLAVVNVYIDLEREKWQALAKEYPTEWYNGYDQDFAIRQDLTYNVRGIPSLYVLNEDKDVIMKDARTCCRLPRPDHHGNCNR